MMGPNQSVLIESWFYVKTINKKIFLSDFVKFKKTDTFRCDSKPVIH